MNPSRLLGYEGGSWIIETEAGDYRLDLKHGTLSRANPARGTRGPGRSEPAPDGSDPGEIPVHQVIRCLLGQPVIVSPVGPDGEGAAPIHLPIALRIRADPGPSTTPSSEVETTQETPQQGASPQGNDSNHPRALGPGDRGRWLVTTRGSRHEFDLDAGTYRRIPGPGREMVDYDGRAVPLTHIHRWPRVGESFFIWFVDPSDPTGAESWHRSSRIRGIQRLAPQP